MAFTGRTGPIDVVVAADGNFARQLSATISGISHFAGDVAHRLFVLHDGYDEHLQGLVASAASEQVELRWINAASPDLEAVQLPDYLPPATLYRLRIIDLLPSDVTRVLYLDTDVVVLSPLCELWNVDLGGTMLAAVRDALCPWAASPKCLEWRTLGLAPEMPYFNAGVMVIPLEQWRRKDVGRQALAQLDRHRFRYGDQCALNVVANGRWTELAPRWNVQAGHFADDALAWIAEGREDLERATRDPAVVHFNSFPAWSKPWERRSTAPFRDAWFDALDRTAWAGWRPDDSPLGRSHEVLRRARRAGGVLLRG